ncbi:DUF2520 domain-containing protein [Aquicella lusitana]|uniref:Uncharacterized protein DUF2520 n=1 Tax=Aquicella lusitana TaxID=254246 RepID=A0A370GWP3_9COXI|nr:DUF2520 domain-containing protein [Aquicella lusitana]RDI48105.1 uncharacterized protein DUF2520 [Aquicella lusitana]VVC72879.1 hypothetical protein AQULUS_06030 [Aquicella lusitana]
MRQVPHYLLIGNGRVARHLRHYFSQLNISFDHWHRHEPIARLEQLRDRASHILLLIKDSAIDAFILQHLADTSALKIHFSGCLVSPLACGAHPLMTFNTSLYSLEQYHQIPFVIDHDAPDFTELLPGIPNQHVRLHTSLKSKYHAFCVLSGNFSSLLWQKLFQAFEKELNLPALIAHPYLFQQMHNLVSDPASALSGPLTRNDIDTIEKNLAALASDPFQEVYKSFVHCFQQLKERGSI